MISAKIIADSKNESGQRITSMVIQFPRFILAELNTHRVFSKNSASSRAIPFEKMVKAVKENPFIPIALQRNHKGMQGTEYITDAATVDYITKQWLFARNCCVDAADRLASNDVTKQLCNRLLEPFMWHTVIVTATDWSNFFKLRSPQYEIGLTPNDSEVAIGKSWKDLMNWRGTNGIWAGDFETDNTVERLLLNKGQAEIHMMALAEAMWDAYNESTPKYLPEGEWHIPFGDNMDESRLSDTLSMLCDGSVDIDSQDIELGKIKIATARCARVSYQNYEGTDDYEKDIKLFDTLKQSGHMSPFEHCAKSMSATDYDNFLVIEDGIVTPGRCRNFTGFIQLRHFIETDIYNQQNTQ